MIDDFSEGNEFLDQIRETLPRILPTLLILLPLTGNLVFASSQLLPQWLAYQELSAEVEAAQEEFDALAANGDLSEVSVLEDQLLTAEESIGVAAEPFLAEDQVADVIQNLYIYADESGVQIFSLRTQETVPSVEEDPYTIDILRAQLTGSVPRLMNFVMRLREATLPTIRLDNVDIQQQEETDAMLTLEILIHVSSYAPGTALDELPELDVPIPFDPPTPTPIPEIAPTVETSPEQDVAATPAEATEEGNGRDCSGLLESPYTLGDVVVVDFAANGALNILSLPRTGEYDIEVKALAYDGYVLRLLAGPVCGLWEEQTVRYWRVHVNGIEGWIGEGTGDDLWLCPAETPNCASQPR